MQAYYCLLIGTGLWVTFLAINISRLRMKHKVGIGDGGNLSLKKAIRGHILALEQSVPFCLVAFVPANEGYSSSALIDLFMFFGVARVLHALSYISGSTPMRQATAGMSYLSQLIVIGFAIHSVL